MSAVRAILPTASMGVSIGWVSGVFGTSRDQHELVYLQKDSYYAEDCKTGDAHHGKNKIFGG